MNIGVSEPDGKRAYRSPARARQKANTRERILDALAGRMAHGSFDSLSMEAIAAAAGVAPATLYRHFPNREALLDGLSDETFNRRLGGLRWPRTADDISAVMRQSFEAFDHDPGFVRAFFTTNLGRTARSRGRRRRIEAIQAALRPLTSGMAEPRGRAVEAIIAYLASIQAWITMTDEFGMTGEQVGQAVTWAIDTLLADVRAHQFERADVGSLRKGTEDGGGS